MTHLQERLNSKLVRGWGVGVEKSEDDGNLDPSLMTLQVLVTGVLFTEVTRWIGKLETKMNLKPVSLRIEHLINYWNLFFLLGHNKE